ncbi:MAG TPA: hypothetical protein VMR96_08910 [Solirubrobacterales bacterium]|nr:hypothetical protein [Solirubrobacterales bacterium]
MSRVPEVVQSVSSSEGADLAAERAERAQSARRAANAVSSVAWIPQGALGEEEWLATGRRLGAIGRGSQWWIGDWVRHGASQWGDRYSEAARATGYDRATLRNMAWIADRVDKSVRNEKLSWDHHVLVSSLTPEEQKHWLERAEQEKLTVADLKLELRARGQGDRGRPDAEAGAEDAQGGDGAACPHCGHRGPAG